jgi:hypothetical protein
MYGVLAGQIIREMPRRAPPQPSAYGLRSRWRPPRHPSVAGAWACAWLSFRALKSKFPGVWCLIIIGTEGYEGGPYAVHRVGRDRGRIKTCGLTIFGGTQPDRLAAFKGLESDGLLQRFCTVVIGPASASRSDIVVHGKGRLDTAIETLAKLKGRDYTATPKGAELIQQTERDATSFGEITDYGPGFQGYVRKLHGTHARLALILHMLDDPECETIPDGTIERAGRLARHFLLPHTRNFYSALPGSTTMATRDLGGWLLTKAKERVLASDITSGVKACRGMGSKPLAELLDPFITGGWLEPEEPFPGNRAWILDPYLIRTAYADRARSETERRKAIRALIGRIDG